jgi:3-keto-disaccharide hydrolase
MLMLTVLLALLSQQPPARPAIPAIFQPPEPIDYGEQAGWTSIFDGRTLDGWSGNPDVWRVEDGAITATSTAEHRVGSTHIIWDGGELADFELKVEVRLDGDIHSGIAYRSAVDMTRGGGGGGGGAAARALAVPTDPRWTLYGPGLDFDADRLLAGNVEDRGSPRREVAWRGGIVRARGGERPRLVGSVGDADALMDAIRPGDWNQVHIIAVGRQLTHIINGQVMTVLLDEDPQYFRASGRLGFQIEMWGAGSVHFRRVSIRRIEPAR